MHNFSRGLKLNLFYLQASPEDFFSDFRAMCSIIMFAPFLEVSMPSQTFVVAAQYLLLSNIKVDSTQLGQFSPIIIIMSQRSTMQKNVWSILSKRYTTTQESLKENKAKITLQTQAYCRCDFSLSVPLFYSFRFFWPHSDIQAMDLKCKIDVRSRNYQSTSRRSHLLNCIDSSHMCTGVH